MKIIFTLTALMISVVLFRWLFRKIKSMKIPMIGKSGGKASPEMNKEVAGAETAGEIAAAEKTGSPLDIAKQIEDELAEHEASRTAEELKAIAMLKLPHNATKRGEILAKHICAEAKKNPQPMAQLIRTWMHEKER